MTERPVVLAVIVLLGVFALAGLGGTIWLVDHAVPAESIAIISGMTGTALGALATMLASTRSAPPPGA